jgi:hypothetical protein
MNTQLLRISPKYTKADWDNLDLNYGSNDWNTAVDIFEDRMNGRFFNQIKILENNNDGNSALFAGFAIIALDCMLIETLEQFIKGRIRTGQGMDANAFYDFFQRSVKFAAFFDNMPKAKIFYQQIRCGLLHQAQTKKKSIIHIKNSSNLLEWIDSTKHDDGISINRKLFHREIIEVFQDYCLQLRAPKSMRLKANFRRKMNYIVSQL